MSPVEVVLLLLVTVLGALVVFLMFAIDECLAENTRLRDLASSLLDDRAEQRIRRASRPIHPALPDPRRFN